MAGRSGSPAEGITLGKTVARELAPFAFSARETGLNRGFSAFEAERGRQQATIPGLLGLPGMEAQNFLNVGQILEDQQRRQALDPFERLNLATGPLVAGLGGTPPGVIKPPGRSTGQKIGSFLTSPLGSLLGLV